MTPNDNLPLTYEKATETSQALVEQTLTGEICNIVYRSPDGAYSVATLMDEKAGQLTIVGDIADAQEGRQIEVRGVWDLHKSYGRQFRVHAYKEILPTTELGIRRYLASGILPGIGPKFADRIVDKFGTDTLRTLDQFSSRLAEIPGIGKNRIRQIREAWAAHAQRRDRYIFCQGLGISLAYTNRIMNQYGDNAVSVIKDNPYRLAEEVKGIGFKLADAVAGKLDIAKDNPYRLGSGVMYVLNQLVAARGHCCYPRAELIAKAAEVLEVTESMTAVGVQRALDDGAVIEDNETVPAQPPMLYPAPLYRAECDVARAVADRCKGRSMKARDIGKLVTDRWKTLNERQREAVRAAFDQSISIITGGPGVGKTTVTREVVGIAEALGMQVALAAPTGRAAKRLAESAGGQASTLHRLLKWQPETQSFQYNGSNPLDADLLVVDEVSMLDILLAKSLFAALKPQTRLILVGDRDQLPSIGPGAVLNDLIHSGKVATTHLTEIYRQTESSRIIVNAHRVNQGVMPEMSVARDEIRDFYWIDQEDQAKVVALICRMVAERIPARFQLSAREDVQVLTPINRGLCGTENLNRELQQVLNPKLDATPAVLRWGNTEYRVGDRVMQISNNYDLGVFNGDLGTIGHISEEHQAFKVRYDTGTVTYEFENIEQLRLAYAITIHKSQGSEFPAVVMPVLPEHYIMLRRNLIYTGMTRAAKLLVMVGARKALALAVKNERQSARFTRLASRIMQATDARPTRRQQCVD